MWEVLCELVFAVMALGPVLLPLICLSLNVFCSISGVLLRLKTPFYAALFYDEIRCPFLES